MTIATELQHYNDGLLDAYDAVDAKGGTIPANLNLDNLPTAIGTISGGGGGDRPADWLKMPTDANVSDNEIYFLLEMAKDRTEDYLAKWGINASANYDIEFGTTVNGAFVVDPTYSETNLTPGAYTFYDLAIPMSIFHTTGETKQVIMRVKTSGNITSVSTYTSGKQSIGKRTIEIKGKATNLTYFKVGTNNAALSAYALRYCTLLGTNNVTNFSGTFDYCYSLSEVSLDTSNGTNFQYMFRNCASLTTIPQLDTSSGTNFDRMFAGCASLTTIPQLDTSDGTNFANMFDGCYSLTKADFSGYDFSSATNMGAFTGSDTYLDGGGKIYLPNKDKFPAAGILGTNAFTMNEDNSNPINYIISDASGMIPLQANGTSIFGTSAYVYVYVPDALLATYQADTYWSTLGTRLKGFSDLPS